MSNCLDPDQDRHSVGPDLGPNSLQKPLADAKSLKPDKELIIIISVSQLVGRPNKN